MNYKKITSYEAACADQGRDPNDRPDYSKAKMSPEREAFHNAIFEIETVLISVNKDESGNEWIPKPEDQKWFPWAWIKEDESRPSGLGLSFDVSRYGYRGTVVASRLTVRDSSRARFVFDHFTEQYCKILIFQG